MAYVRPHNEVRGLGYYGLSGTPTPRPAAPARTVSRHGLILAEGVQDAIARATANVDLAKLRSATKSGESDPGSNKIVGVLTDAYSQRRVALFKHLKKGDPAYRADKRGRLARTVINKAVELRIDGPDLQKMAAKEYQRKPRPPHTVRQTRLLKAIKEKKKQKGLPLKVATVGLQLQKVGTGEDAVKGMKTFNQINKTAGSVISFIPPIGPIIGFVVSMVGLVIDGILSGVTSAIEKAEADALRLAASTIPKQPTARAKPRSKKPAPPTQATAPTEGTVLTPSINSLTSPADTGATKTVLSLSSSRRGPSTALVRTPTQAKEGPGMGLAIGIAGIGVLGLLILARKRS